MNKGCWIILNRVQAFSNGFESKIYGLINPRFFTSCISSYYSEISSDFGCILRHDESYVWFENLCLKP